MCVCSLSLAGDARPGSLPRSAPEKQGIASSAILDFVDAADRLDTMNSFMLVRHGAVVAEGWWAPYRAGARHMLYSLSKSFTSTAVGLAVAEGKLSLDDTILKLFPEDAPAEPGANLKAMRVRDLLRMATGHQTEPALTQVSGKEPWTKIFLAHTVPHKPGTHFLYNTPATYMLSAAVQKATGTTVLDYLRPRLFEPLDIEDPAWDTSPQGVSLGGYGLSIRTEDIARFGQLYLQKGRWQKRQLLPESWVAAATARQTSNGSNPESDWDQGYGFQFWRCRNNVYRGDGAFGQYCIVMPDQDAVVAITSGVRNMQEVLDLVWAKLLPGMKQAPLRADKAAGEQLKRKLAGLIVRPVAGSAASPVAAAVSGKEFSFAENGRKIQSIGFDFGSTPAKVIVKTALGRNTIACGTGSWVEGRSTFANGMEGRLLGTTPQPVAATGAWTANDTYTVKLCFPETPFYVTLVFRFDGEQLVFDSEYNVSFGATKLPQLTGKSGKSAATE